MLYGVLKHRCRLSVCNGCIVASR